MPDAAIADLEGSVQVRQHHIMEAIGYRNLDRSNYFNMSTAATTSTCNAQSIIC